MFLNKNKMTILEAIKLEMEAKGMKNATGINICELIDKHNIEVLPPVEDFMDIWREIKKNEKKSI